jgi:hypothetical protein
MSPPLHQDIDKEILESGLHESKARVILYLEEPHFIHLK